MKKIITSILIVFLLALSGCSSNLSNANETNKQNENSNAEQNNNDSSASNQNNTKQEEPKKEEKPKIEPFVVFEDERVIIKFKTISSRGVVFDVENLTDVNITIQAETVAVNGVSTDSITMSDDVAPQSIGEVVAKIGQQDILKTEEVNRVSGQLRIIDFNRSFDSYDATFNVALNDKAGYYETEYNIPLLYSDDKVDIYYWDVDSKGAYFLTRNKTDVNITIQADSISVNKRSVNRITMSDSVAPQSVGIISAKCTIELDGEIETIGGQLRVIDFNRSFSSYDVSFVNIDVKE